LSAQSLEIEIKLIGIIAESHAEEGEPIVAPNYGVARKKLIQRFGEAGGPVDQFGCAGRVMSTMRSRGLIVRLDDNVWGFRSDHAARARCKELTRELKDKDTPNESILASLSDILSGLTAAPAAAATA
jgi:hypothetical protein